MSNRADYWEESLSCAFDSCGAFGVWDALTPEQKANIAQGVEASHENYGMAFYSPPASDRISSIEREWRAKYEALQREMAEYQTNAETAVKIALRQRSDTQVTIGKYGEVTRWGGRVEQIQ